MVLLGAGAVWSLVTAAAHDGRPEGVLLALLAAGAGYASGRITGALCPVAAPAAAALAGLGLAVGMPHLAPGPQFATPLGHAGATAALLVLATGAACCAAWATPAPAARLALRLLAAAVVVTSAAVGSAAGALLGCGVLLGSLAAGRAHRRGPVLAGLLLTAGAVGAAAWALAGNVLPDGLTAALEDRLSERRIRLWQDALHLAGRDPALGVGPGRFGELSPAAGRSPLPDGKPHSAPLQLAAEQGIVGVVLLAAAFCWVLYVLRRSPRSAPVVLSAGAALTAVAVIAAVGDALSFTTVSVGVGVLAGLATARPITDGASGG
ncbi:O-antigen ligase family protein [Streptomyces sp. NPDC047000]|uniref:O-antigen ligase family protein n=1 Tax=Streptomyces sp. NPDC047000 TaxID=3155474 RepID=UPI003406B406